MNQTNQMRWGDVPLGFRCVLFAVLPVSYIVFSLIITWFYEPSDWGWNSFFYMFLHVWTDLFAFTFQSILNSIQVLLIWGY